LNEFENFLDTMSGFSHINSIILLLWSLLACSLLWEFIFVLNINTLYYSQIKYKRKIKRVYEYVSTYYIISKDIPSVLSAHMTKFVLSCQHGSVINKKNYQNLKLRFSRLYNSRIKANYRHKVEYAMYASFESTQRQSTHVLFHEK